jgi:hypothetical protein
MKPVILAALILSGCAMSNGIQKVGPDTYMVSAMASPVRGGASGAQIKALEAANEHCSAQGKEIMVRNTSTGHNGFNAGTANLTFRCLDKRDAELARPNFRTVPSMVIQQQ